MKIIMNFEISKGYQTWKEAFLKNEAMRQRHNVKVLAYGHEEGNENNVYSVTELPSLETMQEMLKKPEMIELRENAGVVFETQKNDQTSRIKYGIINKWRMERSVV